MAERRRAERLKVSQAFGILGIALILGMVVHKGHADISVLAEKYSGRQFWVALASYFIRNLAGGGGSGPGPAPNRD